MISIPNSDLGIAALAPKSTASENPNKLGQEQFLKLMITQFRNQDPFEPMENGAFLGQLAQFSTVSGIDDMSGSLSSLSDAMYANQALQASSMVGRSVLATGAEGTLAPGAPLEGAVDLPFASSSAHVTVFDALGQPVREINLGNQQAGTVQFSWDGTMADGQVAPPGRYRFTAAVRNGTEELALATFVKTRVQSVALSRDGSGASITTDSGDEISLTSIRAIM